METQDDGMDFEALRRHALSMPFNHSQRIDIPTATDTQDTERAPSKTEENGDHRFLALPVRSPSPSRPPTSAPSHDDSTSYHDSYSGPGDTQPISQTILSNIINQTKLQRLENPEQYGFPNPAQDGDRVHLQNTANDELLGKDIHATDDAADPVAAEEPENEAEDTGSSSPGRFYLFPESQRFTNATPANRKNDGNPQATPQSENPLAGSVKSSGPTIPLSQVFDASSPASHALRSEISDLPSPNIPISVGPTNSSYSRMTDSSPQSGFSHIQQQQATYISMRNSQTMREKMAQKKAHMNQRPSSHGSSDDDFSQESSFVQRQLRDKRLNKQTRKHLADISAPVRPERKSTDDSTKFKSSSPLPTSPSVRQKPPRRRNEPIDIPEPEYGVLSDDSEVETEQEDEPFRWSQTRNSQQRSAPECAEEEEEDKENFDSCPITSPRFSTNPASRTHEALSQIIAASNDQPEPPSRHNSLPLPHTLDTVAQHNQHSPKNTNFKDHLLTPPVHSHTSPPEVNDAAKNPTLTPHEATRSERDRVHLSSNDFSAEEKPSSQEPHKTSGSLEKRISSQKSSKDVIPDSHSQSRGNLMIQPESLRSANTHQEKLAASYSRILATPSQNLVHQAISYQTIPDSIANPTRHISAPDQDHGSHAAHDPGSSIFSSPSGRRRRRLTDIANSQSPRQSAPSFDQTTPFTAGDPGMEENANGLEQPWHHADREPRNHMPTPLSDPSSPKPSLHHRQTTKPAEVTDNGHANFAIFSETSSLPEGQDGAETDLQSNSSLHNTSYKAGPSRKRRKVQQLPTSSLPRKNLFGETMNRRGLATANSRLRRTRSTMSTDLAIDARRSETPTSPGQKTTSPVPSTLEDEIKFPDQVFAFFNGRPPGYYPAKCLGVTQRFGRYQYTVKFDDTTDHETIEEGGVKRLELRVNDVVKIDIANKPRGPYLVLGFDGMESALKTFGSFDCQTVPDIVGHEAVVLRLRADASSPVLIVPISVVYLDRTLWTRLKSRRYIPSEGLINAQAASLSEQHNAPCDSRVLTHSCPSNGALFSNMAFTVSFKEKTGANTTRSDIERLICSNGGRLVDGFDPLFNVPSSSSEDNKDESISLAASAERLGFVCLITDSHSRRVKYMQALAINVPCLASRWIQDCVAANRILPWETYSLPAGESSYLGAVKSRDPLIYPPLQATFAEIFSQRRKPLSEESIIFLTRGKGAENKKAFAFLIYAMGPRRIRRVPDVNAALELLQSEGQDAADAWGWLYTGEEKSTATARASLLQMLGAPNRNQSSTASGSRGVKRQRNASFSAELSTSDANDSSIDPITVNGHPLCFLMNDFICQSLILGKLVPGY